MPLANDSLRLPDRVVMNGVDDEHQADYVLSEGARSMQMRQQFLKVGRLPPP